MNNINKTLYIPLYGKAKLSAEGIIISDKRAEEIWEKTDIPLKGKSKSKWLAYFMAMRARMYDRWVKKRLSENPDSVVLHIGCGLDSRVVRCGAAGAELWYDIDLPEVISERKKYYREDEGYVMLAADASKPDFIKKLPEREHAVVILEGVCMYLTEAEIINLFLALQEKFGSVRVMMDVYTRAGAKLTRIKNPINDVGVTRVYGTDDPRFVSVNEGITLLYEHTMTPKKLIAKLPEKDRALFETLFAGRAARRLYRMFEYEINRISEE